MPSVTAVVRLHSLALNARMSVEYAGENILIFSIIECPLYVAGSRCTRCSETYAPRPICLVCYGRSYCRQSSTGNISNA